MKASPELAKHLRENEFKQSLYGENPIGRWQPPHVIANKTTPTYIFVQQDRVSSPRDAVRAILSEDGTKFEFLELSRYGNTLGGPTR